MERAQALRKRNRRCPEGHWGDAILGRAKDERDEKKRKGEGIKTIFQAQKTGWETEKKEEGNRAGFI